MKSKLAVGLFVLLTSNYFSFSQTQIFLKKNSTKYELSNGAATTTIDTTSTVILKQANQFIKILAINDLSQFSINISANSNSTIKVSAFAVKGATTINLESKFVQVEQRRKPIQFEKEIKGVYDIVIQLEVTDVAEVSFDTFTYFEISKERLYILAVEDRVRTILEQRNQQEFSNNLKSVDTLSFNSYASLFRIYNSYNSLDNIKKATLFIDSRASMVNPMSYTSFTQKFDSLIALSDENSKLLLTNIQSKLASMENKAKNAQMVQKLFKIGGNVLNLISGGHVSSLFTSIKTITATLFNKDFAKPRFDSTVVSKIKGKFIAKVVTNQIKLDSYVNTGIKMQKFFTSFLDTIETQQNEYNELISNFNHLETRAKADSTLLFIKQFNKYFSIAITDKEINEISKSQNFLEEPKIIQAKKNISEYFNKTILTYNASNASRLELMRKLNKDVVRLRSDYYLSSSELYENFLLFAKDFAKPNPYSAKPKVSIEYLKLKNTSVCKYLDLIESLELTLNKPSTYAQYDSYLTQLKGQANCLNP